MASGEVEATSDPSLLLISDVIDVVDALPDVANAAHANAAQESAAAPRSAHLVGVRAMCALLGSIRPFVGRVLSLARAPCCVWPRVREDVRDVLRAVSA